MKIDIGISRRKLFGAFALLPIGSQLNAGSHSGNSCESQAPFFVEHYEDDVRQERHHIFLMLTAALVHRHWRINKSSPEVRAQYQSQFPTKHFSEYFGHNIGAIAVDGRGEVVSFEMNKSHFHNSSLEHAEYRALKSSIEKENARRYASGRSNSGYAAMMQAYTVYSTLEPCSQCAGALDLANVETIVYLQKDPAQKGICNILRRLHGASSGRGAPLPLYAEQMARSSGVLGEYENWLEGQETVNGRTGATAFLGSISAYNAFGRIAETFLSYEVQHGINIPTYNAARKKFDEL